MGDKDGVGSGAKVRAKRAAWELQGASGSGGRGSVFGQNAPLIESLTLENKKSQSHSICCFETGLPTPGKRRAPLPTS